MDLDGIDWFQAMMSSEIGLSMASEMAAMTRGSLTSIWRLAVGAALLTAPAEEEPSAGASVSGR